MRFEHLVGFVFRAAPATARGDVVEDDGGAVRRWSDYLGAILKISRHSSTDRKSVV